MIHHFPNKLELFAATFDYVFERMVERYSTVGRAKSGLKERWEAILGCFWQDDQLEPFVAADIELSLASRVDPVLSARFEINSAERLRIMSDLWRELFAVSSDSDVLVELTMFLTRGLWLVRRSPVTMPWLDAHLAKWREVIEPKLGI